MQIRLSQSDGVPIYRQIANQVKYLVASGRLEAGEKLPSVRKLAEELLVNPNTVARAYRELESERVIVSRQGSGAYVADNGSPLAKREKMIVLNDRIDVLLAEARNMGIDLTTLIKMLRVRRNKMGNKSK